MFGSKQNIADDISDDSEEESVSTQAPQLHSSSFRLHEAMFQTPTGDDENADGFASGISGYDPDSDDETGTAQAVSFTKDFDNAGAPGFRAPQLYGEDPDDYPSRRSHSSERGGYVEVEDDADDN